ncbi:MAG: pantothenate kinase [Clostridia bacterium]|nr:pantothenate kinase [Clostridia bacterium]
MKETVIGIDVGGSTTKIVGFHLSEHRKPQLITPLFVRATDPVTAMYGAFGRFTAENGIALSDIDRVMTTGVGSTFMQQPIYGLACHAVPEFTSIGLGGLYLSGLSEAIVVSMGTGTALIHAKAETDTDGSPLVGGEYDTLIESLGGTGMGGGTMLGLTKLLTGVGTIDHIVQLCESGNLANIDLRVGDISKKSFREMSDNLTASNFGKVSDLATPNDLTLGVANMVAETIAMMSIFAARSFGLRDIVLIGNLSSIAPVRRVFEDLGPTFGVNFIIPENSQFGTVIGAALHRAE